MGETPVVAAIVTFNPELDRLRENLRAAAEEAARLLIVDNASENVILIEALLQEFPTAELIRNATNKGIARALNQAMKWASVQHFSWALLLDQDSVVSKGMVGALSSHIAAAPGIVCPAIEDRSAPDSSAKEFIPTEVDYCITSGSLCSVSAWEQVGGYDEAIFIDFVDFDFCLRLRESHYRIIREPRTILLHEIGKITRHGGVTAYHHSAFRSYYMARDMIYYAQKHRRSARALMVNRRGLAETYVVLIRKAVIVALFEEDRPRRVGAIFRGMISGTLALRRTL